MTHLPHQLLLRYSLERTMREEDEAVKAHVQECDECGARLDNIAAMYDDPGDEIPYDTPKRLNAELFGEVRAALWPGPDTLAAEALDLCPRSVSRYRVGDRKVPLSVWYSIDGEIVKRMQELDELRRVLLARLVKGD